MVALLNTVGDLKFYNFISNKFPGGKSFRLVRGADSTYYNPMYWLAREVLTSSQANIIGVEDSDIYFYFPSIASTPTENETCVAVNTSSRHRFYIRTDSKLGFGVDNEDRIKICYHDYNTTERSHNYNFGRSLGYPVNLNTSAEAGERDDLVTFCVASPSTVVMSTFYLSQADYRLNTHYVSNLTFILGWAHDSVFPAPPTVEDERYNAVYQIYNLDKNESIVNTSVNRRPILKNGGSNDVTQDLAIAYYPINCTVGSYSSGTFLTDLILQDNDATFTQVGKVDNRVACMGRGNFERGRVYQVNNVFGRTGNEEWLCCGIYTNSVALPNWETGDDIANDNKFQNLIWPTGEEDYLMMRVYTEADGV